jgi:hypothetical protein
MGHDVTGEHEEKIHGEIAVVDKEFMVISFAEQFKGCMMMTMMAAIPRRASRMSRCFLESMNADLGVGCIAKTRFGWVKVYYAGR